jgi:transcriptional antiterminator NusG
MNSMTDSENNIETTEVTETTEVAGTPKVTETTEVSAEAVETPEDVPEATSEATSEVLAEVTPEDVLEATSEVSAEVTSEEATPEVIAEVTSEEATPEVIAEVISEEATKNSQDEGATPEIAGEEPQTREGMNWFVLRVASNKEDYVKAALDRKVEIEAMQHLVGRIMVPTEKTKTLSKTGKAKITETKLYPGYIFVEMKLEEQRISQDIFFLIKETTGVGDFVGTAGKPTPMSTDEVDKMLFDSQAPDEVTEVRLEFAVGDHVNIKEGPFIGYEGTVDEIYPEKGIVRVLATVFGRQTPIEIEYWMIEKVE